jgi:hypothetical protein
VLVTIKELRGSQDRVGVSRDSLTTCDDLCTQIGISVANSEAYGFPRTLAGGGYHVK